MIPTRNEREIVAGLAEHIGASHDVVVNRNGPTVAIIHRETNQTDAFLDGDDAARFLEKTDQLGQRIPELDQSVIDAAMAFVLFGSGSAE